MDCVALSLDQLRQFIGRQVSHHGAPCHVIEVLAELPALVLQDVAGNTEIQDNRFGEPTRRVPCTYVIPVLDDKGAGIHPEFMRLGLLACD